MLQQKLNTTTRGAAGKVTRAVIASVCIGLFSASAADAGGIVTKWSFVNDVGFFDALNRAGNDTTIFGSNPNPNLPGPLDTRLDWPKAKESPEDTSSLSVGDAGYFNGGLDTGNGSGVGMVSTTAFGTQNFTPSVDFVHNNISIDLPADDWLAEFKIFDALELTVVSDTDGDSHAGEVISLDPLMFQAYYRETLNAGEDLDNDEMTDNTCNPDNPALGSPNTCADIFVLLPLALPDMTDIVVMPNGEIIITQMFEFWDVGYNINIKLEGLEMLDPDICSAALPAETKEPCLGLITDEGAMNVLAAGFGIECKEEFDCRIPEPGTLAAFGVGLGALGLVRRRRKLVA